MIVRATLTDVATSGSIVGRLSAIATVGAITGTLVTGFVLLGLVPTRTLIVVLGGLLVVIGLALTVALRSGGGTRQRDASRSARSSWAASRSRLPRRATRRAPTTASRSSPIATTWTGGRSSSTGSRTPTSTSPTRRSSGSATSSGSPTRRAPYLDALGRPADVLHLGGGGFTFPRYLEATRPGTRQVVLELDPRVLEVAREELGFTPSDALSVRLGDARRSIETLPTDSFDLVVGDAFGGLAVPWHLTTTEFLEEIQRVLRPGGMYVMNLIDYPPLGFVRAEAATAGRLFDHVAIIAPPETLAGKNGGNVVLVASAEPLDVAEVTARIATWGPASRPGSSPPRPRSPRSSATRRSSPTTSRRSTSSSRRGDHEGHAYSSVRRREKTTQSTGTPSWWRSQARATPSRLNPARSVMRIDASLPTMM